MIKLKKFQQQKIQKNNMNQPEWIRQTHDMNYEIKIILYKVKKI